MEFIDLKEQYRLLEDRIDKRIKGVLRHGQYIMGPEVSELEIKLADRVGVKHCISCANGTDALQLSLMAMGIGPGDAVFTSPFTFFATAEAIALVGAVPVFVDIDPASYNISPSSLERGIQNVLALGNISAKAIMAVNLFGLPADYTRLRNIAERYNLKIIEDSAQGFGGAIGDRQAGSFGDIATTSFFPAKPLGCYGDGGALFTDDDEYGEILRSLRVHGKGKDKYENVRVGMNSRLDTIQAAVLLEKLEVFDSELKRKQALAEQYTKELDKDYIVPFIPEGTRSAWAQYTLRGKDVEREVSMRSLKDEGIPVAIYYDKSLHKQKALLSGCIEASDMDNANMCEGTVFSLPMHAHMGQDDIERVVAALT